MCISSAAISGAAARSTRMSKADDRWSDCMSSRQVKQKWWSHQRPATERLSSSRPLRSNGQPWSSTDPGHVERMEFDGSLFLVS